MNALSTIVRLSGSRASSALEGSRGQMPTTMMPTSAKPSAPTVKPMLMLLMSREPTREPAVWPSTPPAPMKEETEPRNLSGTRSDMVATNGAFIQL